MTFGRTLENLFANRQGGQDLANVQCGIKYGQLLRQCQLGFPKRPDQNVRVLC